MTFSSGYLLCLTTALKLTITVPLVLLGFGNSLRVYRNKTKSKCLKIDVPREMPIQSYGYEIWTMASEEINALRLLERKIVRRTYGPTK
jgi:hypothetical protein